MDAEERRFQTVSEQKNFLYVYIRPALDIVMDIIKQKDFILYGGMSLDLALKERGHTGLYSEDALPDFDFYSPSPYEDAIEIAISLYKEGLPDISSINASHPQTRRTRVMFQPVADVSYLPPVVYNSLPTLRAVHGQYKGLRFVDPIYIRMDFLRFFVYAFEDPPMEPIMHRFKKITKRFRLLDEFYPIEYRKYTPQKKIKIKRPNVPGLIHGIEAYHLYRQWFEKYVGKDDTIFMDYTITDTHVEVPAELRPVIMGEYKFDSDPTAQRYNMYFDTLQPVMYVKNDVEYYTLMDKPVVYSTIGKNKVMTACGVLLYFLRKSVQHTDDVAQMFKHCYVSLVKMITAAEHEVINEKLKYEEVPLLYQINIYGPRQPPDSEIIRRKKCELEGKEFIPELPPFGFYPSNTNQTYTPFDYASSEKFAMDGLRSSCSS